MAVIEKQSGNNNLRRGNPAWGKKSEGNGKSGNPNGKPKKEFSLTSIQKEMMGQFCPYAKDPTWTWAYALAEAGMRDALTEERARENLKDRLEGKLKEPIDVTSRGESLGNRNIELSPDDWAKSLVILAKAGVTAISHN